MVPNWKFFDAKYVLSTPGSKRQESLKENFRLVGIKDYEIVEFKPTKKYTKDRLNNSEGGGGQIDQSLLSICKHDICDDTCQNIAKNMFTLIKKGYDAGHNNIIIFEDDARFSLPFKVKRFNKVVDWLDKNNWDIFYLGYCQWPILVSWIVTQHIVKLTRPYAAHAYCLSRQGMEKILEVSKYYDKLPQHIDKIYGKKNWNKYGIFPAICFQSEDPALFKKAVEKLPIKLRFKSLSRFTEYSSVIIPILIILIIVYFLIYNFY